MVVKQSAAGLTDAAGAVTIIEHAERRLVDTLTPE